MDIRYWMLCNLIIREIIEYIVRTTAEDETVNCSSNVCDGVMKVTLVMTDLHYRLLI